MKKLYLLLLLLLFLFSISSCDQLEFEGEDDKQEVQEGPSSVTLDAYRYDFYAVKLSGKVSGLKAVALDFECGIEYSTNTSFSKDSTWRINANVNYSGEAYSVNVAPLESGQKYYYRAYFINQLYIYYGEVKDFTYQWDTPSVTTLDVIENKDTVILKGVINNLGMLINYLDTNEDITFCGIEYSANESFDDANVVVLAPGADNCDINGDTITCVLSKIHSGNYYYRVFFRVGNDVIYGAKKTFWYGYNENVLIGSWTTDTWRYTFNADHTGSRTRSGRTQIFSWSLDGDELDLTFNHYEEGQSQIVTYTVYIIEELTETKMEVYDKTDLSKNIVVFRKVQ